MSELDWENEAIQMRGNFEDACRFIQVLMANDHIPEGMLRRADAIIARRF